MHSTTTNFGRRYEPRIHTSCHQSGSGIRGESAAHRFDRLTLHDDERIRRYGAGVLVHDHRLVAQHRERLFRRSFHRRVVHVVGIVVAVVILLEERQDTKQSEAHVDNIIVSNQVSIQAPQEKSNKSNSLTVVVVVVDGTNELMSPARRPQSDTDITTKFESIAKMKRK